MPKENYKCILENSMQYIRLRVLSLMGGIVNFEVVEALLYGCASWTLPKPATTRSVSPTTGCCFKSMKSWRRSQNGHICYLVQGRPSADGMRERKDQRVHEEITMGLSDGPYGLSLVAQVDVTHVGHVLKVGGYRAACGRG